MKKNYILLFFLILNCGFVVAQVGINTPSPDAQLDVRSSSLTTPTITDGILIPKVNVFSATNPTISQQGMLVYLTTATTFGGNPKPIGFYYWNFPTLDWIKIATSISGDDDWYKVGTTLAPTSITDAMFHSGNVSIGKNTNTYPLDVTSATRTINSTTTSATNAAIWGINATTSGTSTGGHGIAGITNQSNSYGSYGENTNANGYGIFANNSAANVGGSGIGAFGATSQSAGFGIFGRNFNASGTGGIFGGNNISAYYLVAGSGSASTGQSTGVYARSLTNGIGEAIYSDQFGSITRVNYYSGFIQYKILGAGTVSTTAKDLNGERVVLHCTETPEILFEDYGQSQLSNGSAHIEIDPIIAKNIVVNEKHPLRVYIQLEDNCNGVFVTNKTGNSFDVIELGSGTSNAKFQYHIIGNRADEVLPNGRISKNADARFEPAPKDRETKQTAVIDIER